MLAMWQHWRAGAKGRKDGTVLPLVAARTIQVEAGRGNPAKHPLRLEGEYEDN